MSVVRKYPRSYDVRRWLRKCDLIGRMPRMQWENYVNRGSRQLVHKGRKP